MEKAEVKGTGKGVMDAVLERAGARREEVMGEEIAFTRMMIMFTVLCIAVENRVDMSFKVHVVVFVPCRENVKSLQHPNE